MNYRKLRAGDKRRKPFPAFIVSLLLFGQILAQTAIPATASLSANEKKIVDINYGRFDQKAHDRARRAGNGRSRNDAARRRYSDCDETNERMGKPIITIPATGKIRLVWEGAKTDAEIIGIPGWRISGPDTLPS
jgi:hypothetical protein